MEKRRVAITGMGVVSAIGNNLNDFWDNLIKGQSGIKPFSRFDVSGLRNELMGEVSGIDFDEMAPARDFALIAVKEAISQAELNVKNPVTLITATNFGSAESFEEFIASEDENGNIDAEMLEYLHASCYSDTNEYIRKSIGLNEKAEDITLSLSCSSGTAAIGLGMDIIRDKKADTAIVVGYDSLNMLGQSGLSILRTITNENIRPFDLNRSGTIFGEGAGALVLEDYDTAKTRNAKIYGEVLGYSINNNSYHLTAPDKEGIGIIVLLERAFNDAEISKDKVNYINAHGTATAYFDVTETKAIKKVIGTHIPVSSIKAATGHTMGAAGTIEAIATVQALNNKILPPTLNYQTPDPECDLDYITKGAKKIDVADVGMSISSGIGGNNSVVVLKCGEEF